MVALNGQTWIAYTAVLIALIGGLFAFFWSRESRSASLLWFVLPFALGVVAAGIAAYTAVRPVRLLLLQLGVLLILFAYGFAWQMVRVFHHRRPLLLPALAPSILWFVLAVTLFREWNLTMLEAEVRTGLVAGFAFLSAREFRRDRQEDLPSRRVLFWSFAVFCAFDMARVPMMPVLPRPLGMAPTATWAIITYNLVTVALALLVTTFMIALSRERQSARNHNLAMRDSLTGVYNRRAYYECVQTFSASGYAPNQPYAILIFDLDHFKSINDRFGHPVGDKVIVAAAQAAVSALRKDDKVFRMGGEEFACFLPHTSLHEAYDTAERIRVLFQKISIAAGDERVGTTISIGVAASDGEAFADQVLAQADIALYEAKRTGRNRTIRASGHAPHAAFGPDSRDLFGFPGGGAEGSDNARRRWAGPKAGPGV